MRFYFHQAAEAEFDEAVEYYESCRSGLGLEFAREVYATVALICEYPEAWPATSKSTRRCRVNRFPFGIIFRTRPGYVEVIAVASTRRAPGYWRGRG